MGKPGEPGTFSQPDSGTLAPPPIATSFHPTTTASTTTTTTKISPEEQLNASSSSSRAMKFYDKLCYYKYDRGASADCFYKLAHNKRCRKKRCSCSQGCSKHIT